MASTSLRDGVEALSTLAERDLRRLWRQVDDAQEAREALGDLLPAVLIAYSEAAAALAADWYDEQRDEAGVRGRFRAIPSETDNLGAEALAGYAVGPLYQQEPDWGRALTLVAGGAQLRIANASRETVIGSTYEDPAADGWQRVARPTGCAFCRMLAGRATLYRTENSADFGAHDFCGCSATPAWGGQPRPVRTYTPSSRNITDADRARLKRWLAEH